MIKMAVKFYEHTMGFMRFKHQVKSTLEDYHLFRGRVERNGKSYYITMNVTTHFIRPNIYSYTIWPTENGEPEEKSGKSFEVAYKLMIKDIRDMEQRELDKHNQEALED
jgi:hypothetical protein